MQSAAMLIRAALGATLLVTSGCTTSEAPSPPAAQAPATEAQAPTPQAQAQDFVTQEKACADDGTVPMPADAVGGFNALFRKDEGVMLPIVSIRTDSLAWQTDCPVPLKFAQPQTTELCTGQEVLPRPALLTLKHIPLSGDYELTIAPPAGKPGKRLTRTLRPISAPAEERKHVTWLQGPADAALAADIYVYLRDTRDAAGKGSHKQYLVEVFAHGEKNCDAHRPHLATCKSEDFPDRPECAPSLAKFTGDQVSIKQTDTGTGNEPPRRP